MEAFATALAAQLGPDPGPACLKTSFMAFSEFFRPSFVSLALVGNGDLIFTVSNLVGDPRCKRISVCGIKGSFFGPALEGRVGQLSSVELASHAPAINREGLREEHLASSITGMSKAIYVVIPKRDGVHEPPEVFCSRYSGIGVMILGYPDNVVITEQFKADIVQLAALLAEALSAHLQSFLDAMHWFTPFELPRNRPARRCFCEPDPDTPEHDEGPCNNVTNSHSGGPGPSQETTNPTPHESPSPLANEGPDLDAAKTASLDTGTASGPFQQLSPHHSCGCVSPAAANGIASGDSAGADPKSSRGAVPPAAEVGDPPAKCMPAVAAETQGGNKVRRSSIDVLSPFKKHWWASLETLGAEGTRRDLQGLPGKAQEALAGEVDPKIEMRSAALTRKYSLDPSGHRFSDETVEAEFLRDIGDATFLWDCMLLALHGYAQALTLTRTPLHVLQFRMTSVWLVLLACVVAVMVHILLNHRGLVQEESCSDQHYGHGHRTNVYHWGIIRTHGYTSPERHGPALAQQSPSSVCAGLGVVCVGGVAAGTIGGDGPGGDPLCDVARLRHPVTRHGADRRRSHRRRRRNRRLPD
eukprot:jgi/Botrbrau1/19139/Bobra.0077s0051.1